MRVLGRALSIVLLGLVAACAGQSVPGTSGRLSPNPPIVATPSPSPAEPVAVDVTDIHGLRFRVAAYEAQLAYRASNNLFTSPIASPGQDFLTITLRISNATGDRPQPFLVSQDQLDAQIALEAPPADRASFGRSLAAFHVIGVIPVSDYGLSTMAGIPGEAVTVPAGDHADVVLATEAPVPAIVPFASVSIVWKGAQPMTLPINRSTAPQPSPSPSPAPSGSVTVTDQDGFRYYVTAASPKVAYQASGNLYTTPVAPPGHAYLSVVLHVTNAVPDRPAPLLIRSDYFTHLLEFRVPRSAAAEFGSNVSCAPSNESSCTLGPVNVMDLGDVGYYAGANSRDYYVTMRGDAVDAIVLPIGASSNLKLYVPNQVSSTASPADVAVIWIGLDSSRTPIPISSI